MDLFDHFDNLIEDERTFLMKLSNFERRILSAMLLASWICGNFMKCIIYKSIFRIGRVMEKPVNVLIIVDQVEIASRDWVKKRCPCIKLFLDFSSLHVNNLNIILCGCSGNR
jgi:hypothetical protein